MNYAFTLQCSSMQAIWGLLSILHCSWHQHWHRNMSFCPFFFLCMSKKIHSSRLNHMDPRFNSADGISNPLSCIIIHVTAALILAISPGAIFCPSNVYRENVSPFKQSILGGHNGISTARRGCSAIHAKHVCLFPLTLHNKGLHLINKEAPELFNFALWLHWHSSRKGLSYEARCVHGT